MRPYLETIHHKTKRSGGVAQGVGPEFKPSTTKKKVMLQQKSSVQILCTIYDLLDYNISSNF
jgi:hypothetical protein